MNFEEYQKEIDDKLKANGFDVTKLTQTQKDIILQPLEVPESYYQDGELTEKQAQAQWLYQLNRCGLKLEDVIRAKKMVGIYAGGGSFEAFKKRASSALQSTIEQSHKLYDATKQKVHDKVHDEKKKIALNVLGEMGMLASVTRSEEKIADKAYDLVHKKYEGGGKMTPAQEQLINDLAADFKPEVEKIEKKLATTKNHYGDYMGLLAAMKQNEKTTKILALAVIRAGANVEGVRSALQIMYGQYGFGGMFDFSHSRPKSALMRDRKYTSKQEWEKHYKRKGPKHFYKADGGKMSVGGMFLENEDLVPHQTTGFYVLDEYGNIVGHSETRQEAMELKDDYNRFLNKLDPNKTTIHAADTITKPGFQRNELLRKFNFKADRGFLWDSGMVRKIVKDMLESGGSTGDIYIVVYQKPNHETANFEEIFAGSKLEAEKIFKEKHPTCEILHSSKQFARGGLFGKNETPKISAFMLEHGFKPTGEFAQSKGYTFAIPLSDQPNEVNQSDGWYTIQPDGRKFKNYYHIYGVLIQGFPKKLDAKVDVVVDGGGSHQGAYLPLSEAVKIKSVKDFEPIWAENLKRLEALNTELGEPVDAHMLKQISENSATAYRGDKTMDYNDNNHWGYNDQGLTYYHFKSPDDMLRYLAGEDTLEDYVVDAYSEDQDDDEEEKWDNAVYVGKEFDATYKTGGNLSRDRMFVSKQEWEQKYKRKRPGKKYKKEEGGKMANGGAADNSAYFASKTNESQLDRAKRIVELINGLKEKHPIINEALINDYGRFGNFSLMVYLNSEKRGGNYRFIGKHQSTTKLDRSLIPAIKSIVKSINGAHLREVVSPSQVRRFGSFDGYYPNYYDLDVDIDNVYNLDSNSFSVMDKNKEYETKESVFATGGNADNSAEFTVELTYTPIPINKLKREIEKRLADIGIPAFFEYENSIGKIKVLGSFSSEEIERMEDAIANQLHTLGLSGSVESEETGNSTAIRSIKLSHPYNKFDRGGAFAGRTGADNFTVELTYTPIPINKLKREIEKRLADIGIPAFFEYENSIGKIKVLGSFSSEEIERMEDAIANQLHTLGLSGSVESEETGNSTAIRSIKLSHPYNKFDRGGAFEYATGGSTAKYVAEVMYRDASNYKKFVTLAIPDSYISTNGVPKAGDDLTMEDFGFTPDEFYEIAGVEYEEEYDHNILEILEVKELTPELETEMEGKEIIHYGHGNKMATGGHASYDADPNGVITAEQLRNLRYTKTDKGLFNGGEEVTVKWMGHMVKAKIIDHIASSTGNGEFRHDYIVKLPGVPSLQRFSQNYILEAPERASAGLCENCEKNLAVKDGYCELCQPEFAVGGGVSELEVQPFQGAFGIVNNTKGMFLDYAHGTESEMQELKKRLDFEKQKFGFYSVHATGGQFVPPMITNKADRKEYAKLEQEWKDIAAEENFKIDNIFINSSHEQIKAYEQKWSEQRARIKDAKDKIWHEALWAKYDGTFATGGSAGFYESGGKNDEILNHHSGVFYKLGYSPEKKFYVKNFDNKLLAGVSFSDFETEKEARLYAENFIEQSIPEIGNFGKGGSLNWGAGKNMGKDPRLEKITIDDLEPLEVIYYNDFKKHGHGYALQIIINTVEGDHSQLSEKLREVAEAQEKEALPKGNSDDGIEKIVFKDKKYPVRDIVIKGHDLDEPTAVRIGTDALEAALKKAKWRGEAGRIDETIYFYVPEKLIFAEEAELAANLDEAFTIASPDEYKTGGAVKKGGSKKRNVEIAKHLSKATNFDFRISKKLAEKILSTEHALLKDCDIMCKEMGSGSNWVSCKKSDLVNKKFPPVYTTFEIWIIGDIEKAKLESELEKIL